MTTIRRVEDIEAWQSARRLARRIYSLTKLGRFSRDFGLCDQVQRASASTMSNIAEGFERGGDVEFARFLTIAKESAGEVKSQLYVTYDQGYLTDTSFGVAASEVDETARKIGSLIKSLRESVARRSHRKSYNKPLSTHDS